MSSLKINRDLYNGIYESGSNENDKYVKFNDGTMIQHGRFDTGSKAFTTPYGSAFFDGKIHEMFYPTNFIENPTVQLTPVFDGGLGATNLRKQPDGAKISFYLYHLTSVTFPTNALVYWMAIGKWK